MLLYLYKNSIGYIILCKPLSELQYKLQITFSIEITKFYLLKILKICMYMLDVFPMSETEK